VISVGAISRLVFERNITVKEASVSQICSLTYNETDGDCGPFNATNASKRLID
jgi:hypothetical protein